MQIERNHACRKTPQMLLIEERDPERRDIREIIRATYAAEGSLARVSATLGVEESTVWKWIRAFGGEIRSEVVFPRYRRARREQLTGATA